MAPGDSEMAVVKNKVDLARVAGSSCNLREGLHLKDAGCGPEIYMGDEKKDGELWVIWDRGAQ